MVKVPEDLQSILTDSGLHNSSAELTTKEILSRYGDIVRGNVQRHTAQAPDGPAQVSISGSYSYKSNGPIVTRIDEDPSQANAWQKQSSVRPVQNTNTSTAGMIGQQDFDFGTVNSPYARERSGSVGSQGSYGGQSARQSFHSKPGTLGVTS